ncbi:flavoprotein [Desulfurococcus amylolyticus DSM 16532]|uniref:Flavoprotein n=2 Tax=Desulfurococcus amylolyticus TaxID=94694 RepID=I3XR77_DESAM|nr:flavoprotein [Desulfurococcus amylolyticus DSM 16532]
MYKAVSVGDNVYWVGARDISRRLFDSLIPLPKGTSYNSYLVVGNSKVALIDTVNPGFENELVERISSVVDPSRIDYVIMNHAEPDHTGSIRHVLTISPSAKLVTTLFGARMAKVFYSVPSDRILIVRDSDVIDLGEKTLKFIEAPMLHWPETMFTYLVEDKILFSCDFFGAHVAQGLWDDEVENLRYHAQRYFGEIMMPFRTNALNALKKIAGRGQKYHC